MAKVKIIYDISDPDEAMSLKRALKGDEMSFALHEMLYNTKKSFEWKIDSMEKVEKQDLYDMLESIYERFWEIMNDNKVDLEDLVQ